MIKCFLKNNLKPYYKFISIIVLVNLGLYSFSLETPKSYFSDLQIHNAEQCRNIIFEYYKTGKVNSMDIDRLFYGIKVLAQELDDFFLQNKNERNIEKQNTVLFLYLQHAEAASIFYNYGLINKQVKQIKTIDNDIKKILTLSGLDGSIYLKYADYLYTKLMIPGGSKANIILTLPILYRKAAFTDELRQKALVKLACWYISASDTTTSNFNAQIKESEPFIEDLIPYEKFTVYIWYSVFYMKNYNSKKGWEYFYKAKKMFPSNVLISHLYKNYQRGILSL